MTPADVRELFMEYMDESDASVLSDARISAYLNMGYSDFWLETTRILPHAYMTYFDVAFGGSDTVDLSVAPNRIMQAATLDGSRLTQAFVLTEVETGRLIGAPYKGTRALRSMRSGQEYKWSLQGTRLMLDHISSKTLRLFYSYKNAITWTEATDPVDSYEVGHSLVPCFAYEHYAIRDAALNQPLEVRKARLMQRYEDYLRNFQGDDNMMEMVGSSFGYN
tara:strand:- start:470 stop:1132 length:663 start_codon:yes stop_codon:yes gene_type:complete